MATITPTMNYHDHHDHHSQGHCNDHNDNDVLNAIHDVSTSTLLNTTNATASIISDSQRVAFSTKDSIDKQSIANREAIERTGAANGAATERIGLAAITSVERNGTANTLATERNGSFNNLTTERTTADLKHSIQQIAGETRNILHTHNTQALLSHKDVLLEMAKNSCALERQASDNYAAIQLEACKNKASLELEALKNKESLAAQMAECCCEIKESIISSAATTQLLVRDIESNRVRDALNASNTENLILRLSGNGNANGKS
jgi:hypothetical protein